MQIVIQRLWGGTQDHSAFPASLQGGQAAGPWAKLYTTAVNYTAGPLYDSMTQFFKLHCVTLHRKNHQT